MEVRIASADPAKIPGEIQIKGANVFLGYFKNELSARHSMARSTMPTISPSIYSIRSRAVHSPSNLPR